MLIVCIVWGIKNTKKIVDCPPGPPEALAASQIWTAVGLRHGWAVRAWPPSTRHGSCTQVRPTSRFPEVDWRPPISMPGPGVDGHPRRARHASAPSFHTNSGAWGRGQNRDGPAPGRARRHLAGSPEAQQITPPISPPRDGSVLATTVVGIGCASALPVEPDHSPPARRPPPVGPPSVFWLCPPRLGCEAVRPPPPFHADVRFPAALTPSWEVGGGGGGDGRDVLC